MTLIDQLHFNILSATQDQVVLTWSVGPEHLQPSGVVHGGVYSAAGETAAWAGAELWGGGDGRLAAASVRTTFLRPVNGGKLTVRAEPVAQSADSQRWSADIRTDDDDLVAQVEVLLVSVAALD